MLFRSLGVEPWMILAQAAGLKLDQVERFTEDERVWLDTYRALILSSVKPYYGWPW